MKLNLYNSNYAQRLRQWSIFCYKRILGVCSSKTSKQRTSDNEYIGNFLPRSGSACVPSDLICQQKIYDKHCRSKACPQCGTSGGPAGATAGRKLSHRIRTCG